MDINPSAFELIPKQECIPVGCVPAARRPYAGVCFRGGRVVPGGVGEGVLPGGMWSRGVVSQHALRQTPREQNDRQV